MTNYVLKLTDENFQTGQDYNLFTWPTEPGAIATCPDYLPTQKCGNGFHGYLNGEGALASNHNGKALILEVEDYISLDNGDKIKFQTAKVVLAGEVHEVTTKLQELVGNKAIHYSHVVTTLDNQIMLAGYSSTQTAGDNSTMKIYGSTSYVIKSGKNCTLMQIYSDQTKILVLDKVLKKFEIGDRIMIKEGKVVGKVD
jgi:hypothetical protein